MQAPTGPSTPQDRLGVGITEVSCWTLRGLIILAGLYVVLYLIGQIWTVVLPVALGLLLSTVLWPPVRWLRRHLPAALSAFIGVLALPVLVGGLITLVTTIVAGEWRSLAGQFSSGLTTLQRWLAGPPFNLGDNAIGQLTDKAVKYLQEHASALTETALTSLTTVGSLILTLVLALLLCFFMLKDGTKFLPWLHTWVGAGAGSHFSALTGRIWDVLARYIWAQAAVAAIDAVFIGLGAWILGVPFALPIAVLTFFGGFVPIVGAFVAGFVAVLVALVSEGVWIAVIMLVVIVVVQQLEGNVVHPMLVGRTMKIHPAVVIASVTAGSALFGIIGAFLAVPTVSVAITVANYVRDQINSPGPEPAPATEPPAEPG
jgi:putative heme transporter